MAEGIRDPRPPAPRGEKDDQHDPLQRYRRRLAAASRAYDELLEYRDVVDEAEARALARARRGDVRGAYDEALDHRWAWEHVGVRFAAWLAGGAP